MCLSLLYGPIPSPSFSPAKIVFKGEGGVGDAALRVIVGTGREPDSLAGTEVIVGGDEGSVDGGVMSTFKVAEALVSDAELLDDVEDDATGLSGCGVDVVLNSTGLTRGVA